MSKVLDPSKELRFTRTNQAILFFILAAICLATWMTLLAVIWTVYSETGSLEELPFSPHSIHIPWFIGAGFLYLAIYCGKHPYLLLSPLGVEIFTLWKPTKNFQLVEWGRIAVVEFKESQMILHHTKEKKSGVVLTLSPLHKKSRKLLQKAMEGVMEQRNSPK